MSYLKLYKFASVFTPSLPALLLIGGIGCTGGMIGTGSGPTKLVGTGSTNSIYELENLPRRISPDIPETLKNLEDSTGSDYNNNKSSVLPRNMDYLSPLSTGWLELNIRFLTVDYLRYSIKTNSTIVDLAFDDILNECAEQLLDCTIPADRIRVTITQNVVNRLIELYAEWSDRFTTALDNDFYDEENPENSNVMLNAYIESLLNKEVVLGETHYSQLDGAPYDHAISTVLKRGPGIGDFSEFEYGEFEHWRDERFSVRWHENSNVVKFTGGSAEQVAYEYFYQSDVPSELVTINLMSVNPDGSVSGHSARILGSDPKQAGILVESTTFGKAFEYTTPNTIGENDGLGNVSEYSNSFGTAVTTPDGSVVPTDAESSDPVVESPTVTKYIDRAYQKLKGQVDNNGGYSSLDVYRFDLTEEQNLISHKGYRESFESRGRLLAGERCGFDVSDQAITNCGENKFESIGPEGSSLTDSVLYFTPEKYNSLAAGLDMIRWKLEGIPIDIENIAVISSDSQSDLSESALLCRGVQYVAEDVRVFCTATDEQLDSTVVVELVNGMSTRVIENAKLVQIQ